MSSMFSSQCRLIVSLSALSARRTLCGVKLAPVRGLYSRVAVFTKRTTRKNPSLRMAVMPRNQKPQRKVGKILLPPHPRVIVLNQANPAPQPLQRKRRTSSRIAWLGQLLLFRRPLVTSPPTPISHEEIQVEFKGMLTDIIYQVHRVTAFSAKSNSSKSCPSNATVAEED